MMHPSPMVPAVEPLSDVDWFAKVQSIFPAAEQSLAPSWLKLAGLPVRSTQLERRGWMGRLAGTAAFIDSIESPWYVMDELCATPHLFNERQCLAWFYERLAEMPLPLCPDWYLVRWNTGNGIKFAHEYWASLVIAR